jgi:hypothetical protein
MTGKGNCRRFCCRFTYKLPSLGLVIVISDFLLHCSCLGFKEPETADEVIMVAVELLLHFHELIQFVVWINKFKLFTAFQILLEGNPLFFNGTQTCPPN